MDPALVSYYFGSKSGLFVESLRLPVNPAACHRRPCWPRARGDLGERLATRFLQVWDNPASGRADHQCPALGGEPSASCCASSSSARSSRVSPRALEGPDAELRASAVGSQMLGLAMLRYVLRVEPLASAEPERVVALIAPTLQRYIDG